MFTEINTFYYMRYREAEKFWQRMEEGGRKSFLREELDPDFFFEAGRNAFLPYLNMLEKDLSERDE